MGKLREGRKVSVESEHERKEELSPRIYTKKSDAFCSELYVGTHPHKRDIQIPYTQQILQYSTLLVVVVVWVKLCLQSLIERKDKSGFLPWTFLALDISLRLVQLSPAHPPVPAIWRTKQLPSLAKSSSLIGA